MKIKYNEDLSSYTTIKIGGRAKEFYIPESNDDIKEIMKIDNKILCISGGSNLLINDKKVFNTVVYLGNFNSNMEYLGEGRFKVGASVRLQKLIRNINKEGYGGIEYLFSVPAMLGGAIYMNAGRGSDRKSISDNIESIEVMDENGEIKIYSKEMCSFSYRKSIFQGKKLIILSAILKFEKKSLSEAEYEIRDRIIKCREYQDNTYPNFGSVFCKSNVKIMNIIKKYSYKLCKNNCVKFSKKTKNWLINEGEGTFKQAVLLINITIIIHKIFFRKIEREVIIWR